VKRVRLGTWTCPAGNNVVVSLAGERAVRRIECAWDRYPLSAEDELVYTIEILPAITRRVQEYLEKPGRTLVLRVAP
jgi:hypothetical protein